MSDSTVNLCNFDLSHVTNSNLVVIGKRGTGKSSIVLDYLSRNRDIPNVLVISPTDEFCLKYKPHLPTTSIHDEYTPELISEFLINQKRLTEQSVKDKTIDPRGVLVLDDCLHMGDTMWSNDKSIRWIFMNGKSANITLIVTLPYAAYLSPEMRVNTDYVFILREPKLSNRKRLYDQYCGMFPNFAMFDQVLMATTNNYGCLVIDNITMSDTLEDQVFWYKAEMHGDFKCNVVNDIKPTRCSRICGLFKDAFKWLAEAFMSLTAFS